MPSDAAAALRDMERHIDLATQFVAGLGYEAFRDDARPVYAVTRGLEIISETSRRLPAEMKTRYPAIAWKNMAGAGNVSNRRPQPTPSMPSDAAAALRDMERHI